MRRLGLWLQELALVGASGREPASDAVSRPRVWVNVVMYDSA